MCAVNKLDTGFFLSGLCSEVNTGSPMRRVSLFGGLVLCMLLTGCCNPILYKPSADPSPILLRVTFPENIETLLDFSADKSKVLRSADSYNKSRDLKEIIEIFEGEPRSSYLGSAFLFELYYSGEKAKSSFLNRRSFAMYRGRDLFVDSSSEKVSHFISYIERPRSDPEGLCAPMDYYFQSGTFRISNLILRIEVRSREFNRDMLTKPIEYISRLLDEYFTNKR
jgi:hypothetical protein